MSDQYDPKGRYNVINQVTREKDFEVVKGVLYAVPPKYHVEVGAVSVVGNAQDLTFEYNGNTYDLVPQAKA